MYVYLGRRYRNCQPRADDNGYPLNDLIWFRYDPSGHIETTDNTIFFNAAL